MRWQISNMEVGRPGRAMGQQSPSHAMSNIWGKNTATWRNSKPNSASHSETILSASLLMAVSWIMLLDNWIYSFGKKSNLFRDSRIPLQKANKQTDSYTGGEDASSESFQWQPLGWGEDESGSGGGVMGIRLGMKQRFVLQSWLTPNSAPSSSLSETSHIWQVWCQPES